MEFLKDFFRATAKYGIDIFDDIVVGDNGHIPESSDGSLNLFLDLFTDAYAVIRVLGIMAIIIFSLLYILKYIITKNTNNARMYLDWQKILFTIILQGIIIGAFPYIAGIILDISNAINSAIR